MAFFLSGRTSASDFGDPKLSRQPPARWSYWSPVSMTIRRPSLRRAFSAARVVVLNRIRDRDDAGRLFIYSHEREPWPRPCEVHRRAPQIGISHPRVLE